MTTTYLLTDGQDEQAASFANPLPVYPIGAKSWSGPTTATVATATDTTIAFSITYNRLIFQNNSAVTIYWALDQTASTSMFVLAPSQVVLLDTAGALHVYQASGSAMNVNGASGFTIQAAAHPSN